MEPIIISQHFDIAALLKYGMHSQTKTHLKPGIFLFKIIRLKLVKHFHFMKANTVKLSSPMYNGVKDVPQLMIQNTRKSSFKAVTPFEFAQIFITLENQGDLKYPTGREISSTKI
jgi:hypothetical protein